MLGLRTVDNNIEDVDHKQILKQNKLKSTNNKLKNLKNIDEAKQNPQLPNKPSRGLVARPKPLQASTNTIHTQNQRLLSTKSHSNDKNTKEDELLKKRTASTSKLDSKVTPKTDENDTSEYVTKFGESYDPLLDFCPFDEELYQKVLKLELADDGLPTFNSDEPFDF